jgi:hypothetical protein
MLKPKFPQKVAHYTEDYDIKQICLRSKTEKVGAAVTLYIYILEVLGLNLS